MRWFGKKAGKIILKFASGNNLNAGCFITPGF